MSGAWPIVMPAELKAGRVHLNQSRLQQFLKGRKDCRLTVTIDRAHATRSLAQNAYYHGVILAHLSEHTGHTPDELHEFCKLKFHAKTIVVTNEHGEIVDESRIGLTTTRLNKITFGEYCEAIRLWAAEDLGVTIPLPDPNWRHAADQVVG